MERLDEDNGGNDAEASDSATLVEFNTLDKYRARICEVVKNTPNVLLRLDEPIKLASGDWSQDFIDGKLAVEDPDNFQMAGEAMLRAAEDAGAEFDAVGGLLVGAAPFTFAVSTVGHKRWFLVRKATKGRGTNRKTEGARFTPGMPVMIVDDVVTRGGSIREACEHVESEGAKVVFATTLVDRGEFARAYFDERGIPYDPILTYEDLGIEPVGGSQHARAV
jgi:orotate phosphoribosyltransferase